MSNLERDFYEVDGAAKLLDVSLSDMWHLIEVGRIEASFRQVMANATFTFNNDFNINDFIANLHTFILSRKSATEVAVKGTCITKSALLYLAEPKEQIVIDINGDEFIAIVRTTEFLLDNEVEISRSDIVVTQQAIDQYRARYNHSNSQKAQLKPINEKLLGNTERETLLVIIAALSKEAKVDILKPSKAGELIAAMTQQLGAPVGATTIETHLKRISQALESRTK